ncbi:hypothetical protein EYF80_033694 [Liparis tanakae]|uniref:Uncharacterized protein n=1 Tax=Liparis tanakae TaxID=230148 RepID=A0A4Z2GTE4_9TELE|nr:hypothetical protein EYF80_033694 [Liparis tanakae]
MLEEVPRERCRYLPAGSERERRGDSRSALVTTRVCRGGVTARTHVKSRGSVATPPVTPLGLLKGLLKGPGGRQRSPEAGLENRETSVQAGEDFTLLAVQMI